MKSKKKKKLIQFILMFHKTMASKHQAKSITIALHNSRHEKTNVTVIFFKKNIYVYLTF